MKNLVLSLTAFLALAPSAQAAICDYNYEASGGSISTLVQNENLNGRPAVTIREVKTGELVTAFQIVREFKTALESIFEGEMVIEGEKIEVLFSVPLLLPNPGALTWDPNGENVRETLKCRGSALFPGN